MAVHIVKGDLLQSDCNVIIHQANCFNVMGAGIARQIKQTYPSVFNADRDFHIPIGSMERLGKTSHKWVDGPHGRTLVVNAYGQYEFGRGRNIYPDPVLPHRYFKRALRSTLARVNNMNKKIDFKIGLPYRVGCGLAGGDWGAVYRIIEEASEEYGRDIYLYRLQ